jgi:hypothetical protein
MNTPLLGLVPVRRLPNTVKNSLSPYVVCVSAHSEDNAVATGATICRTVKITGAVDCQLISIARKCAVVFGVEGVQHTFHPGIVG